MRRRAMGKRSGVPMLAVGALVAAIAGCGRDEAGTPPPIPFAPLVEAALSDPDNPAKVFRVDFAEVEAVYPLSRANVAALSPENVGSLSQEELDQTYARLTAGPIPTGFYASELFFARGGNLHDRLDEIAGAIPGRVASASLDTLVALASLVWKGKVFDATARLARTPIEDLTPLGALIDSGDVTRGTIPRTGPLRFLFPGNGVWLLFPAKVYCGQSLLDGRRESIVIDYAYADDIDGFRSRPDGLLSRGGLALRDEIRMVRPGFYLGRAYAGRMFVVNFTLYNAALAENGAEGFAAGGEVAEACWPGEQARRAGAFR